MVSDNDVKQCLHDIIDFFDLVDLANLKERVGTNVLLVREPNGLEAYQLSSPFTVSASSDIVHGPF